MATYARRTYGFGRADEATHPDSIRATLAEFLSTFVFVFAGEGSILSLGSQFFQLYMRRSYPITFSQLVLPSFLTKILITTSDIYLYQTFLDLSRFFLLLFIKIFVLTKTVERRKHLSYSVINIYWYEQTSCIGTLRLTRGQTRREGYFWWRQLMHWHYLRQFRRPSMSLVVT